MPVHLITGKPGAGKTLAAVKLMVEEYLPTGRPIYAYIDGLNYDKLGVNRLVPSDLESISSSRINSLRNWHHVEEGAVVFIDECQHVFPPRNGATTVPDYIRHFETHRHYGQDVVLITQGPRLIDRHLHDLIDRHWHLFRAFGLNGSTVRKWNGVNTDPEPSQNESNVAKERFSFPKKYFELYRSASLHTVKRRLPYVSIIAFCSGLIVAAFGFYYAYSRLTGAGNHTDVPVSASPLGDPALPSCYWLLSRRSGNVLYLVSSEGHMRAVSPDSLVWLDGRAELDARPVCVQS